MVMHEAMCELKAPWKIRLLMRGLRSATAAVFVMIQPTHATERVRKKCVCGNDELRAKGCDATLSAPATDTNPAKASRCGAVKKNAWRLISPKTGGAGAAWYDLAFAIRGPHAVGVGFWRPTARGGGGWRETVVEAEKERVIAGWRVVERTRD